MQAVRGQRGRHESSGRRATSAWTVAGCVGTLACDLAEATFPCRNQVDQAGGPKSAAADKYRRSNAAAAYLGCKAACVKP